MKNLLAVGALLGVVSVAGHSQAPIPTRSVGAAEVVSVDSVGQVNGLRELSDGRLLINDVGARRLVLFDRSLKSARIIADSAVGSANPYGRRAGAIIPWRGDSTLFVDVGGRAFLVLDAQGNVANVMSPPRANDLQFMTNSASGAARVDPKGRLVYRAMLPMDLRPPEAGKAYVIPTLPDSQPLIRADFETRSADTLAWIRVPKMKVTSRELEGGGLSLSVLYNPLPVVDDWAMLSDGSVAVLRGRDYHVDWINMDGTRTSSAKLPFDWKRLSDEDKTALLDSTRKIIQKPGGMSAMTGTPTSAPVAAHSMTFVPAGGNDGGPAPRLTAAPPSMGVPDVVPASELPDYMPSMGRSGNMMVDAQSNVWILPATTLQSGKGLVYDVVNRKGELQERVRLPEGRALVGFGGDGSVFMSVRTSSGVHLERARIN